MQSTTLQRVVKRLAKSTRYPEQLLTAESDLETDLGIDSVKLVEIMIELSEEFDLKLMDEERDASIRTIQDVSDWIDGFLAGEPAEPPAASVDAPAAPKPPAALVNRLPEPTSSKPASPTPSPTRVYREAHPPHNGSSNGRTPRPGREQPVVSNGSPTPAASPGDEIPATQSLAGRVALVTGSGRGVGRVIARLLASRGATVIVNSFHSRDLGEATAEEIRAAGGEALHLWGSVANPKHVEAIFERIGDEFGGLDILVCNASDGRIGPFLDLTPEDWSKAFMTNVAGHHQCAVQAASLMRARGGGSIVTLSAVGAHQYIDGLGSQGVVKAGVESMTRYLACELGDQGIRVNCVSGGPVYGELLSKFPNARGAQDHWEAMTPNGQLSSPIELAETIAFLVSDAARGINGAVWMVDHGFSATADGQRRQRVAALGPQLPAPVA